MLRRSPAARFFSQHNIPVVPQGAINPPFVSEGCKINVGYLLCRQPTVQHALHPLETEFGFVLDREHARYSRHTGHESATHFFSSRGLSIDFANRSDPDQITKDFFHLDAHREATKQTLERFEPAKRYTVEDLFDPCDPALAQGPPVRHTVHRRLDDFLYLIIKSTKSGKWTVPFREREASESLRTSVEQAILSHHGKGVDAYLFGNAPQAVLQTGDGEKPLPRGAPRSEAKEQLFVFCGVVSGWAAQFWVGETGVRGSRVGDAEGTGGL